MRFCSARTRSASFVRTFPPSRKSLVPFTSPSAAERKLRLASHRDAEALTGLQVGGISALALLNKGFDICIDRAAQDLDRITISAGQRGLNLSLSVPDLVRVTQAKWVEAGSSV